MKNSRAIIALSIIFLTFLLTPTIVFAQSVYSNPTLLFVWTNLFKFDRNWLSSPNLLMTNAIIPAFAIFVITLGMMRAIRITRGMGNVEYLIALAVMLAALFTGGLGLLVTPLLFAMGIYAVWIFVAMFLIGATIFAYGYVRGQGGVKKLHNTYMSSVGSIEKQIKAAEDELDKINASLIDGSLKTKAQREADQKRQADLIELIDKLHRQERQIMTDYKNVTT